MMVPWEQFAKGGGSSVRGRQDSARNTISFDDVSDRYAYCSFLTILSSMETNIRGLENKDLNCPSNANPSAQSPNERNDERLRAHRALVFEP